MAGTHRLKYLKDKRRLQLRDSGTLSPLNMDFILGFRNAYRGTAKMYSLDAKALTWAEEMQVGRCRHF